MLGQRSGSRRQGRGLCRQAGNGRRDVARRRELAGVEDILAELLAPRPEIGEQRLNILRLTVREPLPGSIKACKSSSALTSTAAFCQRWPSELVPAMLPSTLASGRSFARASSTPGGAVAANDFLAPSSAVLSAVNSSRPSAPLMTSRRSFGRLWIRD
jgi:hypothetical protein